MGDRFGIGWRPQLAAGILLNADRIDIVEVLADDFFDAPPSLSRALGTLARQIPVALHGVSMGMASAAAVEPFRLERMARLRVAVGAEFWSEHLAFVRGGGYEIGHLAAPPRTDATIEGTVANVRRASMVVGERPLLENIATLIDPPASSYDEAEWIGAILDAANCDLLLDLHNLYANAVNFDFDPTEWLDRIPVERVAAIHLAGGRRLPEGRLLDDHLHDVPEAVYRLLTELGTRVSRPLTVILERDGAYPPIETLLAQLDEARAALAVGRQQQQADGERFVRDSAG